MLVEFRVKNFLSIQEEQVLSMVANSDKTLANTHTFSPAKSSKLSLLKSVAVYGANAAGKSNIIKAIATMKKCVIDSFLKFQIEGKLPVVPFLLGDNFSKQIGTPTEFEATFFAEGVRYQYGFSATKERIISEWLIAYPNGKMQKWFEREYDQNGDYKYKFGSNFEGEKKIWKEATRENALFLSTAAQFNSAQLRAVFVWFLRYCQTSTGISGWKNAREITLKGIENLQTKERILKLLEIADFDIENILIEKIKEQKIEAPNEIENFTKQDLQTEKKSIFFIHKNQSGEEIPMPFELESDGTKRFFDFIGPIVDTLEKGCLAVIDELHSHLHPLMTKFLIDLFHNKEINKNNAQLIFTTHDTTILNQEIFRRDQIYFCEKRNKASILYPLSDFSVRKDSNLESSYLAGRFGALPYFKDISLAFGDEK